MSLNRYAASTDGNQKAIVKGLEQAGITVVVIKWPLDLLCGLQGVNTMLEIKRDEKAPLTDGQVNFIFGWRGQHAVVWTLKQAIEAVQENTRKCRHTPSSNTR